MKSILSKLWIGITSLVIIIVLLLWVFQVGLLNQFYLAERKNSLLYEGEKISALFLEEDNNISEKVKNEIESFANTWNTRVFIYNTDKELIYTNISLTNEKFKSIRLPDIDTIKDLRSLETETVISSKKIHSHRPPFILVKVPIIDNNKLFGNIVITSALAPIKETTSILKKQLSIISLLSLIIATILALVFSRYFTKPILNIIGVTKKISTGDFSVEVSVDSKDELGVLGETINYMAKQLGETENLRRDFIANTSHELKTPISLIKAYSEVIRDINIDENSKKEYLEIIIDESNRLNDMVEDILYLSKIESGFLKPQIEEIYLFEVIEGVKEKLNYFAIQKNIKINLDFNNKNIVIYADKNKIYQVFYNLINNAITHSKDNSVVIVRVINFKNKVRIEIIDKGRGIPKEDLPFIWDRFYKVDKSRKRSNSGTGLGMAIVKNILEAHTFKYGIQSELNMGTIVWFEITNNKYLKP